MTLHPCAWCWWSRPVTRLAIWLGCDVSHGMCRKHRLAFMREASE